ncbi:MAG TPA: HlyD family efflux transporter periplasmic adaptor subunit [Pseudomonadota bacterium]|nr:HlyD family efflux transporter periplasmic adaptor subunit [Pseudomonadota bacterium]
MRSRLPCVWPVLVAVSLGLLSCEGRQADSANLVTVEQKDLVLEVPVHGQLKSLDFEAINPPGDVTQIWQFKILRVLPEGTIVRAGQEVVAFDPSELEKQLHDTESELRGYVEELGKQQAEASLAGLDSHLSLADAESKLRKAELKADKPRDLTSQQQLALSEIDRSLAEKEVSYQKQREHTRRIGDRSSHAILQGHIVLARNQVAEIGRQIARLSVKATRGGTVIYKANWRGEKRKVGDSVWQGETLIEVASLQRMAAQGQVDEVDASRITVGQPVNLRLEAHPDKAYPGRVVQVANLVQSESPESRNKVLSLEITILESDALLMRPGMRFRGRIETERLPGILQIPLAAVESTPSGPVVRVATARGADERRALQLGRRSAEVVEVRAGLRVGDKVLLPLPPQRAGSSGGSGKKGEPGGP